jgi:hypothetical protein
MNRRANGRDHDRGIVEKKSNRCLIKVLIVGLGKTSCKIAKNRLGWHKATMADQSVAVVETVSRSNSRIILSMPSTRLTKVRPYVPPGTVGLGTDLG